VGFYWHLMKGMRGWWETLQMYILDSKVDEWIIFH
jgi:hypothetical protein